MQRADADAADLLHRAHVRDADDDRREDDRRDQHLDELDEAVAERPHGGAPFGRHEPENHPRGNADEDLHVEAFQEVRDRMMFYPRRPYLICSPRARW